MDKDDIQHLTDYRLQLKALKYRLPILQGLIAPLEAQEKEETKTEFKFEEPEKHKKTTDKEVMNDD